MLQKIAFIGPERAGKSQIVENLVRRQSFTRAYTPTISTKFEIWQDDAIGKSIISDTAGQLSARSVLPAAVHDATIIFIVVGYMTLCSNRYVELEAFLNTAYQEAPSDAQIRIVVNKMDMGILPGSQSESKFSYLNSNDRQRIEKTCRNRISLVLEKVASEKLLPLKNFDVNKDVIFYSAAEQILMHKPLAEDSVMQAVQNILTEKAQSSLSDRRESFYPSESLGWNVQWEWLKRKLKMAGKILLFLLIASLFTALFIAIGGLIGGLVGAWSGPGAFFTTLLGAFTGAVTAWNLTILIISPLFGFMTSGAICFKAFVEEKVMSSIEDWDDSNYESEKHIEKAEENDDSTAQAALEVGVGSSPLSRKEHPKPTNENPIEADGVLYKWCNIL